MSSTIVHSPSRNPDHAQPPESSLAGDDKDPFLRRPGRARARAARAARPDAQGAGAARPACPSGISPTSRSGIGNASILVLRQVAQRAGLLAGRAGRRRDDAVSPEWLLIRELLRGRGEADAAARAPRAGATCSATAGPTRRARRRIALIGLRGAGKSTLGRMLADELGVPFVELNREIERIAGCSVREIHALYGPTPTAATSGARSRRRSPHFPRR